MTSPEVPDFVTAMMWGMELAEDVGREETIRRVMALATTEELEESLPGIIELAAYITDCEAALRDELLRRRA